VDPKLLSAAVSGVSGPVLKALVDHLFSGHPSSRKNTNWLRGGWHAIWQVTHPTDFAPSRIEETITLKVKRNGKIEGHAANPYYDSYTLVGEDAAFAITLAYRGTGLSEHSPGIVILLKGSDSSQMAGVWLQYQSEKKLIGGTVTLRRL
jgi:hypothetical protein